MLKVIPQFAAHFLYIIPKLFGFTCQQRKMMLLHKSYSKGFNKETTQTGPIIGQN